MRNIAQKINIPLLDVRETMLANRELASMICIDGIDLADEEYRFVRIPFA